MKDRRTSGYPARREFLNRLAGLPLLPALQGLAGRLPTWPVVAATGGAAGSAAAQAAPAPASAGQASAPTTAPPDAMARPPSPLPAAAAGKTVLVFGDSLSAGYGMAAQQAWPSLLAQELGRHPVTAGWTVVNASISGETTHGGAARLPAALALHKPKVVILELGGNDALRGLPLDQMQSNLAAMLLAIQRAGARPLLVGIALPPNFGEDFTRDFAAVFREVAGSRHVTLVPNLVAALGSGREDFQQDGIHPLPRVQDRLLATVLPALRPLLR